MPMNFKKFASSFVVTAFCAILGLLVVGFLPAGVYYTVTEHYQFTAPEETDVVLIALLPKDGPYQTVSIDQPFWGGNVEIEETEFIDILTLSDTLPAGTHEAVISYKIRLRQGSARWDEPIEPAHLQPQPRVESDHPAIIEKALELGKGTSRKDAFDIFSFVVNHLTVPSGDRINVRFTALETLQSGVGVCEDYSQLAVALLRSRGIPARVVSGLSFQGFPTGRKEMEVWGHPGGSHAWIEIFTGERWEMAEPTWADDIFTRSYFGRSFGEHLSFGDSHLHDLLYNDIMNRVSQRGTIIAAMSAPLKFAASSTAEDAVLTPTATVQNSWDGRWLNGLMVFAATLVGSHILMSSRFKKEHKNAYRCSNK